MTSPGKPWITANQVTVARLIPMPLLSWLLYKGAETGYAGNPYMWSALIAGTAFREVASFLESCLARIEGLKTPKAAGDSWGGLLLGAALAYLVLVAAWVVHAEWTYNRETWRAFETEVVPIGLDRPGEVPDLAGRLDRMAAAVRHAEDSLARAPVHLLAKPLGFDASADVEALQAEAEGYERYLPAGSTSA